MISCTWPLFLTTYRNLAPVLFQHVITSKRNKVSLSLDRFSAFHTPPFCVFVCFAFCFLFFKKGFLYVALVILRLCR